MDSLLQMGLTNALLAGVLALGVAAISRWCRSPALVHSLWLLVLLKLVVPPFVHIPVDWQPGAWAQSNPIVPSALPAGLPSSSDPLRAEEEDVWPGLESSEVPAKQTVIPAASPGLPKTPLPATEQKTVALAGNSSISLPWLSAWRSVAAGIWIAGSVTWFAFVGLQFWRVQRLLRFTWLASSCVQERGQELGRRMGMTRCPTVWLLSGQVSPMLWALLGRPRLLMPAKLWDALAAEQRDTLLVHELAHLRRGDHWVRRLELVVTGLFWWHPVVWWAQRRLGQAEEECCDAWVVATLPAASESYAEALVATVAFLNRANPAVPLGASGIGAVHLLKRRLTMILNGSTPNTLSRFGTLAVLGVAVLLLPLGTALAQREAPRRNTETRTEQDDEASEQPRRADEIKKARLAVQKLHGELQRAAARMHEIQATLQQAQAQLARMEGREDQDDLPPVPPLPATPAAPGFPRTGGLPRGPGAGQGFGFGGAGPVSAPTPPTPPPGGGGFGAGPGGGMRGGMMTPPAGTPAMPGQPGMPPMAGFARGQGGVGGFGGGMGGGRGMDGQSSPEKRLRDLEKKLDRLLEQVDAMRKERGRGSDDDRRQR